MRFFLSGCCLLVGMAIIGAGELSLQKDIDIVLHQGAGTPEGRSAWQRLSQAKTDRLPQLLEAMNTKDTVAANWLRTALDQIVARDMQTGAKTIDTAKLLVFVKDPSKHGRARRFALELVERLRPGASNSLYRDWLDDPEFRYEAVAQLLDTARNAAKAENSLSAVNLYRQAFDKARDVGQAREAAAGLASDANPVSVAEHLGFLMDWYLIGPFDGKGEKGFHLSYAPEKKIGLGEELDGQSKKVRWKRYHVQEPSPTTRGGHQALVNLRDKSALGAADDAVAFAYTEFSVDQPVTAEMRGAADDNFTVWVNGVKVFGFEEWRNGVRHDRHRFPVKLIAGKNTVLVKVCQSSAMNADPNWEFFLRVVDATGKGIPRKNLLK
jgi:hypothetical protein